jgi:sec-independent protein translocase protein TatA
MRNPEIWIGLVVLGFLLFGAKRMPDAARGLGRSLRIFKAEMKGMGEDEAPQQPLAAAPAQLPPGYQPQPVYQQPVAQPVYQQPVAQPAYQQPVGQPVYQQPVAPAPVAEVPQAERHDVP